MVPPGDRQRAPRDADREYDRLLGIIVLRLVDDLNEALGIGRGVLELARPACYRQDARTEPLFRPNPIIQRAPSGPPDPAASLDCSIGGVPERGPPIRRDIRQRIAPATKIGQGIWASRQAHPYNQLGKRVCWIKARSGLTRHGANLAVMFFILPAPRRRSLPMADADIPEAQNGLNVL